MAYLNIFRIIHLGISFLLLFTAFNTLGGLIQSICSDLKLSDNFGLLMQGVIYLSFSIFSFFTGGIISKFGTKRVMAFSSIVYFVWILFLSFPAYCVQHKDPDSTNGFCNSKSLQEGILIFMSTIVGIAAGPMWVSQPMYVDECSIERKTDFFQGIFWSIFMVQSLLGNVVSYLIFKFRRGNEISTFSYIIGCSIIAFLGVISYSFLSLPRNHKGQIVVNPSNSEPLNQAIPRKIRSMISTLKEKKMILLLPTILYGGVY